MEIELVEYFLEDIRDQVEKIGKSVLQTRRMTEKLSEIKLNAIIFLFNEFVTVVNEVYIHLDEDRKHTIAGHFRFIRDRAIRIFSRLGKNYSVPNNYRFLDLRELYVINEEDMEQNDFVKYAMAILREPFDGSPLTLTSFIDALELIRETMGAHEAIAVRLIKTRLTGKARDLISDQNTINDIREQIVDNIEW